LVTQLEQRDTSFSRIHSALLALKREVVTLTSNAKDAALTREAAESALSLGEAVFDKLERVLEESDSLRVREVHINWTGAAGEVVLCGSFDDWTAGVHLSPSDSSPWSTWRGSVFLLPGAYEVKWRIDGEWRCADGWKLCTDPATGATNNLLVVP